MFSSVASSFRHLAVVLATTIAVSMAGCGDGVSGTYEGQGGDKIEFDGGKVYVTMNPAPTLAGEYEIDGNKVILKVAGQSMVLTRNGDTLEGGPFGQSYTKGGKAPSTGDAKAGDSTNSVEGLYVLNMGNESMSLELGSDGHATMTINEGGVPDITEGRYRVKGDTVSITANGETNDFRLIDGALEGGIGGMTLRFTRQ